MAGSRNRNLRKRPGGRKVVGLNMERSQAGFRKPGEDRMVGEGRDTVSSGCDDERR
jgi:hypothetical protein